MRASHLGFSTYTHRFTRFDAELTFDPKSSASQVVATIEAGRSPWTLATGIIDISAGSKMLDTAKFRRIVFKSGADQDDRTKSMEISGLSPC